MKMLKSGLMVLLLQALILTACNNSPASSVKNGGYTGVDNRDISVFTNLWESGICHSSYRNGQSPEYGVYPSYSEIKEDLLILAKKWKIIRGYDSGIEPETTLQVIKNENIDLKVFLGAWISQDNNANDREVSNCIRLANLYSNIVVAVIVGNEALFSGSDHKISTSTMINYIRQVRQSVKQPVTVADTFDFWITQPAEGIAEEVDFIMAHVYPLWWGQSIDNAMSFTINHYNDVKNKYSSMNKYVVIGEAGWATKSDNSYMNTSQANEENQEKYYKDLNVWAQGNLIVSFFFSSFDQEWKHSDPAPSGDDPEKHWGVFTTNRKAKLAMYADYPELIDPAHIPSSNH